MKLTELMSVLPFASSEDRLFDIEIQSIETDSRNVRRGSLFVCLQGFQTDGHLYVAEAIDNGAVAVIAEKTVESSVPVIYVNDSVRALALVVNEFYNHPSAELRLIGVTGTNGKTTVTYILDAIFQNSGKKTGVIGTIQNKYGDVFRKTNHTTPDSLELQKLLKEMKEHAVEQVIMEVSSHALELGRVHGCDFDTVVFTNLSQDHLDFHTDEADYFRAKSLLFSQLGSSYHDKRKFAVINGDDPYAALLKRMTAQPVLTFGMETNADVLADEIELIHDKSIFRLKTPVGTVKITSRLTGKFNIYNMLAATTAALAHDIPLAIIKNTLQMIPPIPGRFETIDGGQPFGIIVDYAHTPDAVRNVLETCRGITDGKLYCVLGCGGDRDQGKRPLMAREAVLFADHAIFTSDNPRTEDPQAIIDDMLQGLPHHTDNYDVILDRQAAIERAVAYAEEGDIVLIAGKGHETNQEINGEKQPFDDRIAAQHAIKNKEYS